MLMVGLLIVLLNIRWVWLLIVVVRFLGLFGLMKCMVILYWGRVWVNSV